MLERMPKFLSLFALAMAVANVVALAAAEETAADLRIAKDDSTVSVFDAGRPAMRYRYAKVPMKPYVDQLFSPGGVQVLRDSPRDHQHHHALMFATAVDGVDFWSEVGQGTAEFPNSFGKGFGKEIDTSLDDVKATVRDGAGQAGFVERLDWIGPLSKKLLLVERRAIHVLKGPALGATLIEWQSSLQTPPGKSTAVLTGSHYFGLGIRFLQSMDSGGRFFNADDKLGEIVRGDERLTPVKWSAYTAKADGKPVTVAIFDHPETFRHPAAMFTMSTPFAYLSATRNEWKEPITIKAGKPLDLCYGVAVWDGAVDKKTVEALYQRWLKLRANGSSK
jgi:hypothetical protein